MSADWVEQKYFDEFSEGMCCYKEISQNNPNRELGLKVLVTT